MPTFNWPLVGHKKIVNYLTTVVKNRRLNHAYLFWGPAGVGKELMAEYFIRSIYCVSKAAVPCADCLHCRQIERRAHPDIVYLNRPADKKNISAEQVRLVRNFLQRGTFLNSHKVVLIKGAEHLSPAAANSLLKILEEPFGKTVFLLLAERIDLLPPTVISRLESIKFLPVSRAELCQALRARGLERKSTLELASLASGLPGSVMALPADRKAYNNFKKDFSSAIDFLSGSLSERFALIEQIAAQTNSEGARAKARELLTRLTFILRDLLLIKSYNFGNITHVWASEKIAPLSARYSLSEVHQFIVNIIKSSKLLDQNINTRLALENIAIRL